MGEYIILRFVLFETKTDSEKRRGVVTLGDDTDWWHNSKEQRQKVDLDTKSRVYFKIFRAFWDMKKIL